MSKGKNGKEAKKPKKLKAKPMPAGVVAPLAAAARDPIKRK